MSSILIRVKNRPVNTKIDDRGAGALVFPFPFSHISKETYIQQW